MAKQKKDIQPTKADEKIIRKIYIIREQKVMLDFDLADLYEVETKRLNEQVKRNLDRFPIDFMFRLSAREWQPIRSQNATASVQVIDIDGVKDMRSQIATASQKKRNVSATPYAFTEHGVTMLASILKSERAVKMSIAVVRAFIELKKTALQYSGIIEQIQLLKEHLGEHDVQLDAIYTALENLMDDKVDKELKEREWIMRKRIGFKSG
jgi:phage regulator Rha-like protein